MPKEILTFLQPEFNVFFSGVNSLFGLRADIVNVGAQLGPFAEVDCYVHVEMFQPTHLLRLPHRLGVFLARRKLLRI